MGRYFLDFEHMPRARRKDSERERKNQQKETWDRLLANPDYQKHAERADKDLEIYREWKRREEERERKAAPQSVFESRSQFRRFSK